MPARLFLAGLVAAAIAAPALAQDIDTTAPFTVDITGFGPQVSRAYGQTFTVGAESYLSSFSLYLDGPLQALQPEAAPALSYKGYIFAWDGAKASGPALYASDVRQFTGTTWGQPEEQLFLTGDLLLTSGQEYVAFLATSEISGQLNTVTGMPVSGAPGSSPYAGGYMVATNHPEFADLTTTAWHFTSGSFGDAWFKADFSARATAPSGGAPEPATWALMLCGFGLLGAALRRRGVVMSV